MERTLVTLGLLTAIACSSKSSPPAAGSGSSPTPPVIDGGGVVAIDAAARAAADKPVPAPVSKASRVEYKAKLSVGRKLAKAAKWPEAIAAFEAALVAIPGDERALAELSFAAMSAGDHARARAAGRQAVLTTTDPKLKAAALYNLGRVEEQAAAPAKAAALYRESLALRPNKTVEERLAGLGAALAAAPATPVCATPMPEAKLCECLLATVAENFEPDADRPCELGPTAVDGWQTVTYATSSLNESSVALAARVGTSWAVVGHLASVYNPGAFGISEEWTLDSVKEEKLGDRTIVRIESTHSRTDSDMGIDEVEGETSKYLMVCVRDPKGGVPTCPLDVTTDYTYERDRLGLDDEALSDVADLRTKGLPIRSETRLTVTLGADGVAQVRAERGRSSAVGDVKLW